MERHPRLTLTLTVLDEMLRRLEQAQQAIRLRRLSVDNVEQRVAASLLALVDKFGAPQGETIALDLHETGADLVALTGRTP